MDISSEMVYSLVPIFLSSVLGVNKSLIGLIEGIAEATASLVKMFAGWLSDKLGRRKPLMLFGYSISTLSRPILALAGSWGVVLVRPFHRSLRQGRADRPARRDRGRFMRQARTGPLLRLPQGHGPVRGRDRSGGGLPGPGSGTRAATGRCSGSR